LLFLQVLAGQRAHGADLAALQAFNFSSLAGELQVGGVFIRVFNQRGRSGANASNATVTGATAAAASAAAAGPAAAAASYATGGVSRAAPGAAAAGAAAAATAAAAAGQPQDPAGFCKALVRYLYDRLVERCYRGSELHLLPHAEAVNVLEVVQALHNLLEAEPRLLGLLSSKSAVSPLVACITPAAAAYPPLYEAAAAAAAAAAGADKASEAASAAQQLADTAEQLAALGLQLLGRAVANAAVQEAVTDEALLRQLFWLAVQPPSARVLGLALGLLRRLSASPLAASVGGYQGGAVLLLSVLLHNGR
jgi:DnaJ family protein C protein 13